MLKEDDILSALDNYKVEVYYRFVDLGNPVSYLIDSRVNIFKKDDRWAFAIEQLGYNQAAGAIILEIGYFGNCLVNLEYQNGFGSNYYSVYLMDDENFKNTTDYFSINEDALNWIVRGISLPLSHNKHEFQEAGIELKEFEPGRISVEEEARLLIISHSEIFRATDPELYKSIPVDLEKILVVDEWYHKDFSIVDETLLSDERLKDIYDSQFGSSVKSAFPNFDNFLESYRNQEQSVRQYNKDQWENNRPGSYETWQMFAKVICTGDLTQYKPTLEPNSHWKYWPDSGSL